MKTYTEPIAKFIKLNMKDIVATSGDNPSGSTDPFTPDND